MEIRELRAGNYVLRPDGNQGEILYFCDELCYFEDQACYAYHTLSPIPITKELLESVGFEYVPDVSRLNRVALQKRYLNIRVAFYKLVSYDSYDLGWAIIGKSKVKINGFHHLQNIIYDLTGVELSLTI